jgi:lysozyme
MDVTEALAIVMRLCLAFEGLYLRPYLCPAGVPTIGVGSTRYLDGRAVTLNDPPITREHAMVLLRHRVLTEFMPGVRRLCGAVDSAGRLAALTDFAYNLGLGALRASTLRRRVLAGRWDLVPAELSKWVLAGGRRMPGLVKRRSAEVALI